MNKDEQIKKLAELCEHASNLLYGPLMFLRGTPGHDIHKASADAWCDEWQEIADSLDLQ